MRRVTKWLAVGVAGLVGIIVVAIAISYDDEIHALWLYVHSVPPKNARGH